MVHCKVGYEQQLVCSLKLGNQYNASLAYCGGVRQFNGARKWCGPCCVLTCIAFGLAISMFAIATGVRAR